MFWVNLVSLLLIILFWIGVCYLVFEFLKQLIDKKKLESEFKDLETKFQEYQEYNSDQMKSYQQSYEKLSCQYDEYHQKVKNGLKDIENEIDEILQYTDQMVQINQDFFDKIQLISSILEQGSPSQEKIKQLTNQMLNDIEIQRKFRQEQTRQISERRSNIERFRERGLHKGQDFER